MMDPHQDMLFDSIGDITKLQDLDQERLPDKDFVMREFARRLREAEQLLENTLEEYGEYRNLKRIKGRATVGAGLGIPIDVAELVAYAHRISYTTFAPPEYATGQFPLRGAFPPAPQDEQMRASQLYHTADIDIGIPRPLVVALSPTPLREPSDVAKVKGEESPQSLKLPSAVGLPAPPPGWRPGLPIELPTDLPPMPPGWKPGDPIPLPPGLGIPPLPPGWKPGDAVVLPPSVVGPRSQDQKPVAPLSAAPPPTPPSNVIQVPFVQLDLNPELEEDFGSDYSDEDGSSDEDED
ncbi:hypothetical protein GOP47_0021379 [Adiantum capillus-veneris]|uniref:Mediator of RNA polymerase II transcription subunit 4 n=1 Tax=Adiantum capillus-veneris TaxID=13818 RepID=A0A9D4U890_ADICA|nr:hypothetical protein GOP47_0021379 [Adiantum capillus-veneris]